MKHLIISIIGPDRPGLVELLSNIIKRHNGNWQKSSMHNMSGHFAGIVEVAVNEEAIPDVTKDIENIPNLQTQIVVASASNKACKPNVIMELTANDRAGIIQDISSVIHLQGGNLIKLVSKQENAAHTGQLMFKAKATVAVEDNRLETLIAALENLADDLMVDISR